MPDKTKAEETAVSRDERQRNEAMMFYQLKLESCYLQSGSIKGDFKVVKDAAERSTNLVKRLEKELTVHQ